MEKKLLVVLVVVGLCSTAALALDPMGPATAGLKQGQFSAGLDGAYSEMDLNFDGDFAISLEGSPLYPCAIPDKLTFEGVEMHKAYFNLGYGVIDNVEVFLRLGGARAEAQKPTREIYHEFYEDDSYVGDMWIGEDGPCHDFDTGFAIGFGGKVTVWQPSPELNVGVLAQASWTQMDIRVKYQGVIENDNTYTSADGLWAVPSDGELTFWEVQLALGATYELSPKFKVYGGPFYYWLSGDYDFNGCGIFTTDISGSTWDIAIDGSYDVEDEGCLGGYLGAQIAITDNVSFNAECQGAKGALAFATGIVWKF